MLTVIDADVHPEFPFYIKVFLPSRTTPTTAREQRLPMLAASSSPEPAPSSVPSSVSSVTGKAMGETA